MLGTLVQSFTGYSLEITVVAATLVGSLFLYKGGLLADVRVSVLAFAMMYFGFAMMVIFCVANHSGSLMAYAKATPAMVSWNGGQAWTVIVGFFILGAWTLVDPGFHQRVASTASPEVSLKGLKWAVACWAVFDLMTITTGLFALSLMKEVPANPLLIFPLFGNQILPSGLKAVFFCGMLGTILCAMVGYALVSGATFGREIVAGLAKVTVDHKVKVLTRVGIFVSLLVAIGLALSIRSVVSIWYNWG
jgi:SSS family solute:Na+ symporter